MKIRQNACFPQFFLLYAVKTTGVVYRDHQVFPAGIVILFTRHVNILPEDFKRPAAHSHVGSPQIPDKRAAFFQT